jgi:Tol biopolymer transport system component
VRGSRTGQREAASAVAVALLLLCTSTSAAQVPPNEKYLRFETEHFRVVFPEGGEEFARRAAASAEWAYEALSEHFMEPPPGRIALVITDNRDSPNASATPIPSNRVVLIATPSIVNRELNYYTDWVDLTLVHELTHIFHLDRADGVWRVAQAVFGRSPIFFPAFYQPNWVVEGLATYYESRLTGAGRAYGSWYPTLLANEAAGDGFRTVDAADGLSPTWPAGSTPYAYGGLFFRAQAEEHGDSAVAAFTRRGAARLPFTLDWAATPYFGDKLTADWDEWASQFEAQARVRADSLRQLGVTVGRPLSAIAWAIRAPRFSPDGGRLAFSFITPTDDPATMVVDVTSGEPVLRVRRNSSGGNSWARDEPKLYLSQSEFADRYNVFSDLYALDVERGRERRLTAQGRISKPDVAPDGRSIVAVQTGEGTSRLVVIDIESGELSPLTEFADAVNWESPRWSPDGSLIAAERWVQGRVLNIVILDRAGELVREVTSGDAADITPAWSPDGRYLVWSSDRGGVYDIYAIEVGGEAVARSPAVWQVTRTVGGASDPDVSRDGRWLAYVALYSEGMRLEVIPFDPATWSPAGPEWRSLRRPASARTEDVAGVDAAVQGYSPFPSLWPKSWLPFIAFSSSSAVGNLIGATTFGTDDVRRHAYGILAGWRTGIDRLTASAAYSYSGFGDPVLQLNISQDWDDVSLATRDGEIIAALERERRIRLAASFLVPRVRRAFNVVPTLGLQQRRFEPLDPEIQLSDSTFDDIEAGLVMRYATARSYPRSVSSENGFSALLALAHERLIDDLDRWRWTAQSSLTAYKSFPVFGHANHVAAARLAAGYSYGHQRGSELFDLGGVPGRPLEIISGVSIFGGTFYPVRGFDEGIQIGDRIVSGSLEYRFPIWLVGRGYKLWPVMLDRVSASLFTDAGSAWREGEYPDVIASAGGELSLNVGLGYGFVTRFRIGIARTVVVPDGTAHRWSGYLTAGVAF